MFIALGVLKNIIKTLQRAGSLSKDIAFKHKTIGIPINGEIISLRNTAKNTVFWAPFSFSSLKECI